MTRHGERGLDGRFVSTSNTPESTAGDVGTYADGLPVGNVSADARGPLDQPRHGPQADALPGEPARGRRAILIDADSGQHLGTVDQDALRHVIGRRSGHLADHVADEENYIVSGT